MAFDQGLAQRIRELLLDEEQISERKMFGGLAFMQAGHMFVGITGESLMVRVGPNDYQQALQQPHVREMDFTGKPLKGFVYVSPTGYESDADLLGWVQQSRQFVSQLPPK